MKKNCLVILATTKGATSQLQNFLLSRDWEVHFFMEPEKALTLIPEINPSVVVVSDDINLPSAKELILSLSRAHNFVIINFTEKLPTINKGIQSNSKHFLKSPITGSNFLRIVDTIKLDVNDSKVDELIHVQQKPTPEAAQKIVGDSVSKALSFVVSGGPKTDKSVPTTGSNTLCVLIESENFSGYVLTCLGNNRALGRDLIGCIRSELSTFLSEATEEIVKLELLPMKLDSFGLENLAKESSGLCYKGVHDGSEIAMALVPGRNLNEEIVVSDRSDMLKISVNELAVGKVVEFDLFHYLPLNKKYIKLSHKGYTLEKARFDSLVSKVTHMHLKKDEKRCAELYLARLHLSELVDDHIEKLAGAA
jgi:hypothetical protein